MTKRTYASIYTLDGHEIAVGLNTCDVSDEAIDMANKDAAERGEPVELHDADGVWLISPRPLELAKWVRA
jgi:hypothetical protein